MLRSMSRIYTLDARRARGAAGGAAEHLGPDFGADDLLAAVDDHTLESLARKPRQRRAWLVPRGLLLADLVGLSLAYFLTTMLWGRDGAWGSSRELVVFVLTLPCWFAAAKMHGLYKRDHERPGHSTTDDLVGVFHIVTIGAWLLLVASRVAGHSSPGIYALMTFWALSICIVPLARTIARHVCRRSGSYEQNAVIVGAGEVGQLIARKFAKHPEYGVNVVGFVDREPKVRRADLPEHLTILGPPSRLPEIVDRLRIERVIIAFSRDPAPGLLDQLRELRGRSVQIDVVPRLFDLFGPYVTVHSVEGLSLLGVPPVSASRTERVLKRGIDVVGAAIGLAVLAPLLAYISIRIRLDSGSPILFKQTRLGVGKRPFTALKFRTMKVDTDQSVHAAYIRDTMSSDAQAQSSGLFKLNRADSVTPFGRWLRRTSLDELPQLFNVLRGDMSLVGPRPCIPYEVDHFKPHHHERFAMPQGITGLWQVTARANSTFGESLDLDVAYVRSWSLGLDLQLLLRTPLQVLRQRSSTA
jgi:exopolysaccharide biosynthesis polyprenyl glycosylphosphotransferase